MSTPRKTRTRVWRHVTTRQSYASIAVEGVLLSACNPQSRRQAIWLHEVGKTPWAILHTMVRHGVNLSDVIVLEVLIDRNIATKHGTGLWYCTQDIPPGAIRAVIPGEVIARQTPTGK